MMILRLMMLLGFIFVSACSGGETADVTRLGESSSTTAAPLASVETSAAPRAKPVDGTPGPMEPNPFDNRYGFSPVVLAAGQDQVVIVNTEAAGGYMVAEVWDVRSNSLISTTPSDFIWRVSPSYAWTGSEVLIAGGSNGPGLDSVAVAFDPVAATWRTLPNPSDEDLAARLFSGPGAWDGTRLLVRGSGLAIDPQSASWAAVADPPSRDSQAEVSFWHESALFSLESCGADGDAFARCEGFAEGEAFGRFDTTTGTWDTLPDPPVPPVSSFAGAVFDRELVVHAYSEIDGERTSTFLSFDLDQREWSTIDGPELVSPFVSISSTVDGVYFLVETRSGPSLYRWQGSSLDEAEVGGRLTVPQGNSMAVTGGSLVIAGPALDEPFIVALASDPLVTALPLCADLPEWDWSDESGEFTEAQLINLANQVWSVLGAESGLQGAGIGRENAVGLEFVDPPAEGFDELLAQLPDGYCIDLIVFTPEPPEFLDVISETGEVSALPEGVDEVHLWFPPFGEPEPDATEISFWADEQECASGREMGDRMLGPEVYESDTEILIAIGVAVQLTGQTCPSNPPTAVTVVLDAPVGDREIRNAITGSIIKAENNN